MRWEKIWFLKCCFLERKKYFEIHVDQGIDLSVEEWWKLDSGEMMCSEKQ